MVLLTSTTSLIWDRDFSHFCTLSKKGWTKRDAAMLWRFIVLSSSVRLISSTDPRMIPLSSVPRQYLMHAYIWHTYVHTYTPTHPQMHAHTHAHTCSHTRTRTHTHTRTHTRTCVHTHKHTHTRTYVRTHTHTHTHACTHARTHTHTRAYMGEPDYTYCNVCYLHTSCELTVKTLQSVLCSTPTCE